MIDIIQTIREFVFVAFCVVSSLLAIAGVVGLYRFPDCYSRLQGSSVAGTTAVFTAFLAALLIAPNFAVAARVVLVIGFFLMSNPTATHIIARYAWQSGVEAWSPRRDQ